MPEKTQEQLKVEYDKLADELLSPEGRANSKIQMHATLSLASGFSPEETVLRSHLFDIALQVENADLRKRMAIIFSLTPTLTLLKDWKDKNIISEDLWSSATSTLVKVTNINQEQTELLKKVLEELNTIKFKR